MLLQSHRLSDTHLFTLLTYQFAIFSSVKNYAEFLTFLYYQVIGKRTVGFLFGLTVCFIDLLLETVIFRFELLFGVFLKKLDPHPL